MNIRVDLICPPHPDAAAWRSIAARAEARGFDAVLCPEVPGMVDPLEALGIAASHTELLKVGTHVLAAPLHLPGRLADRVASTYELTGRRLEIGLGTGRAITGAEAVRRGLPDLPTHHRRRERLEAIVTAIRALDTPAAQIPMAIAAGGPRGLDLAGRLADTVVLALPPHATIDDLHTAVDRVGHAPGRHRPGIAMTIVGIGDRLPAWTARRVSSEDLRHAGAAGLLPADPAHAAAVVAGWIHDLGVTRVLLDADLAETALPVLERLRACAPDTRTRPPGPSRS